MGEPDNRTSQYWFARYWAEALAAQSDDPDLADEFQPLAEKLAEAESQITDELLKVQGKSVDIGGYYHPDPDKREAVMRPSDTFNDIIS